MRKNSKKQTAASRKNGAKGKGPTSAEGKQKSRLNALKDGLFSKEVVVTAAGERIEDLKKFEAWAWDSIEPDGAIEEILTVDVVENYWGRQRVRRCRAAALQAGFENLRARDYYLLSDGIEALKIRFQCSLERYQATTRSTSSTEHDEIVTDLESARSELASTSLGLAFLINKVNAVKEEAQSAGQISPASEVALRACAGLMNDFVPFCVGMNWLNKTQSAKAAERVQAGQSAGAGQTGATEPEKAKGDQIGEKGEAGASSEAERRTVLVHTIEMIALQLRGLKRRVEMVEKLQCKSRLAETALLVDDTCDRFERAETAYDRRLYRALTALAAIKEAKKASKILS